MHRVLVFPAAIWLILVATGCADDPTMLAKDGDPCVAGAYLTLSGTIDEVENIVIDLLSDNPDSTDLLTTRDYRLHIELDLRTNPASGKLEGTAKVLQTQHSTTVHVEPIEGCGDTLYNDYEDREWTVEMIAEITCSPAVGTTVVPGGTTLVRVYGMGTPDGSEVPQRHRYHNGSCIDQTRDEPVRDTWGWFSESGFVNVGGNELRLDRKSYHPIAANAIGESYKEVHLQLTLVPAAPP